MNLSLLQGEEKLFLNRLDDLASNCYGAPKFTAFLSSRQLMIAEAFVEQRRDIDSTLFYGGFSDAARQVMGIFSSHQPPDTAMFPIRAVTAHYRKQDQPSHRDFLGSLMGLLITRESIGDIILDDGYCTLFVLEPVERVVLGELKKVGRIGVRCEPGTTGEIVVKQEFETLRGTVPSMRLDCVVSLITGISREKSARLIRSEKVQLAHITATEISKQVQQGDTVVVRGYGKYEIDSIGAPTRKGRLPVVYSKYK